MNFLSLIEAKRDGGELSPAAIADVVSACGDLPDGQLAAFLMAVCCRGMTPTETRALTLAMRDSGTVLTFPADDRPLVDKHSTGGVGDKVSLVLAPLLACLGFRVPMISGRGLGITGGTLDKLESIPGVSTQLSSAQIIDQVQTLGVAMGGQTAEIAPADRRLYALRDVTGTVPSIPLITASILSKKLAEGLDALVMDVKFGAGAFMADEAHARELARSIVVLGGECGVTTTALLSRMDAPLGRAVGNWLEVKEAATCLDCRGPADLEALVVACAARLVGTADAEQRAQAELASGRPRKKFDELLVAQGADLAAFSAKLAKDTTAPVVREFVTPAEGFVACCDARLVGEIVRDLGGGRVRKDTVIQPEVGLDQLIQPGEAFGRQSTLARVHAMTESAADAALARLEDAFEFTETQPEIPPLICGEVTP
ncbi:MAG: thymidine phosphorylase [Verrucomicrobiota bacterium]|nr:thymidine phosphorylase [Verrucomicrobiota bacterium]